ncbi:hypothetical protein, partial [Salipiger profundus]
MRQRHAIQCNDLAYQTIQADTVHPVDRGIYETQSQTVASFHSLAGELVRLNAQGENAFSEGPLSAEIAETNGDLTDLIVSAGTDCAATPLVKQRDIAGGDFGGSG